MTYYSGQHGRIKIKPQASSGQLQSVGSLRNWALNMQLAVLDTTSLAATDRTLIPGIRSYNGSATMLYYQEATSNVEKMIQTSFFADDTNTIGTDNASRADYGQNTPAELAYLQLQLVEGSNEYNIDCNVYITSFSISCAVGEVVTAEIGFEGHGLPATLQL